MDSEGSQKDALGFLFALDSEKFSDCRLLVLGDEAPGFSRALACLESEGGQIGAELLPNKRQRRALTLPPQSNEIHEVNAASQDSTSASVREDSEGCWLLQREHSGRGDGRTTSSDVQGRESAVGHAGDEVSTAKRRAVGASLIVLAGRSAYFRKMFEGDFQESSKGAIAVHVEEEDCDMFVKLVELMHSGNAASVEKLPWHDTLRLLVLADRFEVPQILSLCIESIQVKQQWVDLLGLLALLQVPEVVLKRHLTPDDWTLALKEVALHVKTKAELKEAEFNEAELRKAEVILQYTPLWVMEVFLGPSVMVKGNHEDELADLALDWTKHHSRDRSSKLKYLGSLVWPGLRASFLSPAKAYKLAKLTAELLPPEADVQDRLLSICCSSLQATGEPTRSASTWFSKGSSSTERSYHGEPLSCGIAAAPPGRCRAVRQVLGESQPPAVEI